jgi:FKBP-type peptidyl-prolyl cis-trans isomerase SlpA
VTDIVRADSLVTLHYRIALGDDTELLTTFDATPATLQLGRDELAPALERCLVGLPVGVRHVFLLDAGQAFGAYRPELVERRVRDELPQEQELTEGALIEFKAPDGAAYAGRVRRIEGESVDIDFNHPLAGKPIRFEVEVIGIL